MIACRAVLALWRKGFRFFVRFMGVTVVQQCKGVRISYVLCASSRVMSIFVYVCACLLPSRGCGVAGRKPEVVEALPGSRLRTRNAWRRGTHMRKGCSRQWAGQEWARGTLGQGSMVFPDDTRAAGLGGR